MSINNHHSKLPRIPGESLRAFFIRYMLTIGERLPSRWEMENYYQDIIHLEVIDVFHVWNAIEWCGLNIQHNDWFTGNVYFFFSNATDAALFRLAVYSKPVDLIQG